ncbi:zinc-finger domain-containing protein [Candidatus Odyssella thessalonicensis]|uniref:zinc-finger domain-containing protein n=1 Tax=Candidatus Odyssella thessalonicensis TaxID=84647 RepID=UPI000225B726|nr:zinc-finger domain-containing protein [Candidatus Odyssella thessalonicensis]
MIEDVRYVDTKTVNCDGNGSSEGLGHPSIYLNFGLEARVVCPYCSRVFVYEGPAGDSH